MQREEIKLRLLFSAAAASAVAFAAPVCAQEATSDNTSGAYVTVGVGGTWAGDPAVTYKDSGTISGINWSEDFNVTTGLGGGVGLVAGVGYDFGNSLRAELTYELGRYAIGSSTGSGTVTIDGTSYTGVGSLSTSGTLSTNSVLVSGYYDIQTKTKFTPYVGGGIGYTNVSIPDQTFSATGTALGYTGTIGDLQTQGGSAGAFGYQAKLGVSYEAAAQADLFAEVLYTGNSSVTINNIGIGSLNNFGVRGGFRYRFGK
ncbi:outer membrane protein [Synechococcus sp. LTW-R]|uniref:outer membrane protein n=1 Tax=Synechococcus sp. LTW-R TaxID=2751170 RepID=UPI00162915D2|nr:outer membrane beta-barrel protein [Synechococcus sp. LTW-R]